MKRIFLAVCLILSVQISLAQEALMPDLETPASKEFKAILAEVESGDYEFTEIELLKINNAKNLGHNLLRWEIKHPGVLIKKDGIKYEYGSGEIKVKHLQATSVDIELEEWELFDQGVTIKDGKKVYSNDVKIKQLQSFATITDPDGNTNLSGNFDVTFFLNQALDAEKEIDIKGFLNSVKKSADMGFDRSAYLYARLSDEGGFVEKDIDSAVKYYEKSATANNPLAQDRLADLNYEGIGTIQDYSVAIDLYAKAAEEGVVNSQKKLAYMYASAEGTEVDPVKAHYWYNIAASLGDEEAKENRDKIAKLMTQDQLKKAQGDARRDYKNIKRKVSKLGIYEDSYTSFVANLSERAEAQQEADELIKKVKLHAKIQELEKELNSSINLYKGLAEDLKLKLNK